MCLAPKPPSVKKPRPQTPIKAPEEVAQEIGTPDKIQKRRQSAALLGLSSLRQNLQANSGLNIPQ